MADLVCGGTWVLRSIRSRLWALVIATIIPFTVLIAAGIWIPMVETIRRPQSLQAISEARLLSAQIDDHIGNLENLPPPGPQEAVSTDPRDVAANEMRQAAKGQGRAAPGFLLPHCHFLPPMEPTSGRRAICVRGSRPPSAKGHIYFEQALAGQDLTIGDVAFGTTAQRWLCSAWLARSRTPRAKCARSSPSALCSSISRMRYAFSPFQGRHYRHGPQPEGDRPRPQRGWGRAGSGRNASSWPHLAKHFTEKEGSDVGSWSNVDGGERGDRIYHRPPRPLAECHHRVAEECGLRHGEVFRIGHGRPLHGRPHAHNRVRHRLDFLQAALIEPLRQLGKDASLLASGELGHRSAWYPAPGTSSGTLADDFKPDGHGISKAPRHRGAWVPPTSFDGRRTRWPRSSTLPRSRSCAAISGARPCCGTAPQKRCSDILAEEVIGFAEPADPRPIQAADSRLLFERAASGETRSGTSKDGGCARTRNCGPGQGRASPRCTISTAPCAASRCAYEDITDSKRAQEQLIRLAHYDPVDRPSQSPLLARRSSDACCQVAPPGARYRSPCSISTAFKDVNDTLGAFRPAISCSSRSASASSRSPTSSRCPAKVCRASAATSSSSSSRIAAIRA